VAIANNHEAASRDIQGNDDCGDEYDLGWRRDLGLMTFHLIRKSFLLEWIYMIIFQWSMRWWMSSRDMNKIGSTLPPFYKPSKLIGICILHLF
jgi:hypothetical protein